MKFFFACAFLGVLFSFTLAFINKHQKKANKLLSVCLLSIAAYVFHLASINAHLYYKFPAIYAVLLPFQYLIVPTAYLYVRCFLKGNVSFRRRDWVHFIPFILSILLYLKYYFTTNENKLIAIDAADNNFSFHFAETDMLLPVNLLVVIKITLAFTYLFFQWKLIKEWLIEIITAPNIYKDIFSWLKAFTVLISLFIACYAFANLVACYAKSTSINAVILTTEYGLCFSFFAILLNLFFHPKILFGMMGNIVFYALNKKQGQITNKEQVIRLEELVPSKQMAEELIAEEIEGEEPEDDSKVFSLTPEKVTEYKQKLENLMTEQKAFLIHGCNLKDVALALAMPRHHLSIIINSEYRVNFNDFINKYRVEFLKEKMLEPESQQLTLDGLAKEAGFSSRATFFRAFTKFTGETPSDFLKKASKSA